MNEIRISNNIVLECNKKEFDIAVESNKKEFDISL